MQKRFAFLIPVFIFIQFSVSAQVQVGIMAGPQFSIRHYNKSIANNGFITSGNAGVTSIIPVSKKLALHGTLGYSGKGVIIKDFTFNDVLGNDMGKGDINILLHYIELRSPVDYIFNLSSGSKLLVGAGPYISYAVGGHQKIKNNDFFAALIGDELDFENEYNRFEFGITSNIGLQFSQKWLLSIYTDLGLTDIFKMESSKNISHRSFSFTLGYAFWHQKKKENKK